MRLLESETGFSGGISVSWRAGKTFLSASNSQFVLTGPAKILKIGQRIKFLWPK